MYVCMYVCMYVYIYVYDGLFLGDAIRQIYVLRLFMFS